jgi:hypothetical protein
MVLRRLGWLALVQLKDAEAPGFITVFSIFTHHRRNTHMLNAIFTLALVHTGDLALVVLSSPPPLDPTNLLKDIFTWLVKILAGVGMVYFVIDLFKHVASSPRDLGAAGKDALVMVVLLAVAAKADVLVTWAQSAL